MDFSCISYPSFSGIRNRSSGLYKASSAGVHASFGGKYFCRQFIKLLHVRSKVSCFHCFPSIRCIMVGGSNIFILILYISFVDVFLLYPLMLIVFKVILFFIFSRRQLSIFPVVSLNPKKDYMYDKVIEQVDLCQKQESQLFRFIQGKHRAGCSNVWWHFQKVLLKSLCMSMELMSFYDDFLIRSGFRHFLVFLGMIGTHRVRQRSPVVP